MEHATCHGQELQAPPAAIVQDNVLAAFPVHLGDLQQVDSLAHLVNRGAEEAEPGPQLGIDGAGGGLGGRWREADGPGQGEMDQVGES